jgi:hypothetical protein
MGHFSPEKRALFQLLKSGGGGGGGDSPHYTQPLRFRGPWPALMEDPLCHNVVV